MSTEWMLSSTPIEVEVCRCFVHGLNMCAWFKHYRQIICLSFFQLVNFFCISDAIIWYSMSATPPTILDLSFWYCADVLFMV